MKRTTLFLAAIVIAADTSGCFVSHKETVREVPVAPTTTVEKNTTVETVPSTSEVRTRSVETY